MSEFNNKIQELSRTLDDRSDKLGALDSLLMQDRLKKENASVRDAREDKVVLLGIWRAYRSFYGKERISMKALISSPPRARPLWQRRGVVVYSDYPFRIW